jgi:hypothetical protein
VGRHWATRLNDQKTGVKIVIQQRIHEDDLTGHILETEGTVEDGGEWVHLCLPAEYEPAHPFVCPREITLPSAVSRPAIRAPSPASCSGRSGCRGRRSRS